MLESSHRTANALPRPPSVPGGGSDTPTDLGGVRAVIEGLPEAVFVMDDDGRLRLTNPAADQLFAGQPIRDRADLLSRFEAVGPDRRARGLADGARADDAAPSAAGPRPVTVRSRQRPNRWYALRTIAIDDDPDMSNGGASNGTVSNGTAANGSAAPAAVGGRHPASSSAPGAADDPGSSGDGRTVFVLRDVTDSRDLQPEREAFLSVLSHELRTPITTIYAGSSVLARRQTLSPPASRILAHDISAEAARLYDLVEDLLILARLERQVLDPLDESILLQRAVESTIRVALDRTPGATIERTGAADLPAVHGDSTYVEQACRNLILTSLRFAGPGPDRKIVIDLEVDHDAGEVTLAVRDRGPAMGQAEQERAFELPDPAAVGRLAGAGIGLFVCRHLVEAMGGRAWARNRADGPEGAEFGFALRIDERA
jgi:nitrogen-specific signal transduction histidine kinase